MWPPKTAGLDHCAVGQKVLILLLCSVSLTYTKNRLRLCRSDQDKALTSRDFGSDDLTTNNISQQLFISALTINFRTCCSTQNRSLVLTTSLHYRHQCSHCVQLDETTEWWFVTSSTLADWSLRCCDSKLVNTCSENCGVFIEV